MPSRSHKSEKEYKKLKKTRAKVDGCVFCKFDKQPGKEEVIKEFTDFWVVENTFPYDIWDDQGVVDHIMVVPKRHMESLGEMNTDEMTEFSCIIGSYDKLGYSIYARSFKNSIKSVPHQHTHLIKLDAKEISFMIYSKKPHVLIKK